MRKNKYMVGLSLWSLMVVSACTEPTVRLTYNDLQIVDSLYKEESKWISPYEDSVCNHHHDARLRKIVDSIFFQRLKERETLMNSIQQ